MKFDIDRDALLEPLQYVSGVVERRQTLPVLSNLLIVLDKDTLVLTGTDQEVELSARITDLKIGIEGETTVPARKLVDICKSLPSGTVISFEEERSRIGVESGRFKSHLSTLPAVDFPDIDMAAANAEFSVSSAELKQLLDKTAFAMAQQDVRYFFNGMLFELEGDGLTAVATNGQRLAITKIKGEFPGTASDKMQIIVPRKGIIELGRMLKDDSDIRVTFTQNHLRVESDYFSLTTKLIDATYPEFQRAIPSGGDKLVVANRRELKEALTRTAILSNEMYRNVRVELEPGNMVLRANNPLQEEAEENVAVEYSGQGLEIGFNVGYLIDALGAIDGEVVHLLFSESGSPVLITDPDNDVSRFIISPMIL